MGKSIGSDPYKVLLALIRSLRVDAGLTQMELAKKLNRPQTWVSKTELGERRLDLEELRQLADALDRELLEIVFTWLNQIGDSRPGTATARRSRRRSR